METASFGGTVEPEEPPAITSSPPLTAQVDALYEYQVVATDADGDPLTYSLAVSPSGMSMDSEAGLASWTPAAAQIGTHDVEVRVADGRGAWDSQPYTVTVSVDGNNRAPEIVSTPVVLVDAGDFYEYDVDATDPDGDGLTYSMHAGPAGMTIDPATGLIT